VPPVPHGVGAADDMHTLVAELQLSFYPFTVLLDSFVHLEQEFRFLRCWPITSHLCFSYDLMALY